MNGFTKNTSPQVLPISRKNSEFEKYLSLVNILKGFEEYTLNVDGVIVSSNLEAVNITGYEEWEVIGKTISIFYPIEDQLTGKPSEDLARSQKFGSLAFTSLWTKKRNSYFLASIRIKTLTEDGILIGFKLTLQDSTHKAVTSHKLKTIKDEYLSLFNNAFVGIVKFTTSDYEIFMMNEKAEKIISRAPDRGKLRFNEIFDNPDDFLILKKKLIEDKKIDGFQFQMKGGMQWLMVSLRYFPQEHFIEGVLADVTEIKNKDNEIIRLNQELDQFVYHASHELRSPLTSILGLVNLLKLESDKGEMKNYLSLLESKVRQMDSLLTNIVAIGFNSKRALACEEIDWDEFLASCVSDSTSKNSAIKIETEIKQTAPFKNDSDRLKIILRNLLSNAQKYHNPNLKNQLVKIEVVSTSDEVKIKVVDNGIGIDKKYLDRIFEMFYKAHTYDGSGLGLYIVKIMVERLDGNVKAFSNPGEGSTFIVTIPNLH